MLNKLRLVVFSLLLPGISLFVFFTYLAAGLSDLTSRPYLVKDITSDIGSTSPAGFTAVNGKLFFHTGGVFGSDDLWVTDGTTTNTIKIVDDIAPLDRVNFGNKLFFHGNSVSSDYALWKSDGTVSGTQQIKQMSNSSLNKFTVLGAELFFVAEAGIEGRELWKTNGTEAGTLLVKDINPREGSEPSDLTIFDGRLFFSAYEGYEFGPSNTELWVSDGTLTGTARFKELYPGGNPSPTNLTVLGDKLFFVASNAASGRELWVSDGTITGTVLLKDIYAGGDSQPQHLNEGTDKLFFTAYDDVNGRELWISDGTLAGTTIVKDITPGSPSTTFLWTAVSNNRFFFVVDDSVNGRILWVSDGTEDGTKMVKDINLSGDDFTDYKTTFIGAFDKVYFTATDGVHGVELWQSDGTESGTYMIEDLNPSGDAFDYYIGQFGQMGGRLFFSADDGQTGYDLWALDVMPEVEFTEEQYTVDESTSHATITVTLDALTSTSDVTVEYFTSNGTAVTGSDYTSSTGILTIPIGAKTITFTIPILNDTEFDPDETIILTLTNPEGSVLGGPITSILRIVDDEKYTVFLPTVINPE